ncbi:MAG: hypothetical protein NC093_07275 [Alistipes sp.]|nr:hypothetical protein [Alistipes sp.]
MIFLKIISFPIRLVLFLILGLLSLLLLIFQNTFLLFLNFAASLIALAGSFIAGLGMIGIIIGIIMTLRNGWSEFKEMGLTFFLCIIFITLLTLFSGSMPTIVSKLYSMVFIAAVWLWGLAKVILFCDTDRFYI